MEKNGHSPGFEELIKLVSSKWKGVDDETLSRCKHEAKNDNDRYFNEMKIFRLRKDTKAPQNNEQFQGKRKYQQHRAYDLYMHEVNSCTIESASAPIAEDFAGPPTSLIRANKTLRHQSNYDQWDTTARSHMYPGVPSTYIYQHPLRTCGHQRYGQGYGLPAFIHDVSFPPMQLMGGGPHASKFILLAFCFILF